ncbi:Hsp20/alpha crystallin family protein [Kaarinaea lacus]
MNDINKLPSRDSGWSLLDDPFDNFFEGFFRPMRRTSETGTLTPAVDVTERDKEFVVKADLPGIKKEDINITLQDSVLTISAESKQETEDKHGERVIRRERRYGKFVRSMQLGQDIDETKVKASFNDGVLELVLQKKEEAQPKKVTVQIS